MEDVQAARRHFPVATVQNRYNLTDRADDPVVDYCEQEGIGFIPWYPLASGDLAKPGGPVDEAARAHGATPGQVALAWVLHRSPVMLPIPGTSSVSPLEDNVGAASLHLSEAEYQALDKAA